MRQYERSIDLSITQISRKSGGELVRFTLVPVEGQEAHPWQEYYLDVPAEDEVPTGTVFTATLTFTREDT